MRNPVLSRNLASRSRYWCKKARGLSAVVPLVICFLAAAHGNAQSAGACLPWPATTVPFDSAYYVLNGSNGDRLVVGNMSMSTYSALRSELPAPAFVNQEFCGSVMLAPGLYANAYVPTAAEWSGDFSNFPGQIRDPFSGTNPTNGYPFAGNIIPSSRIPAPFAWRIDSHVPTAPATPPAPLRFLPVTPCRVADTREAMGLFGTPQLAAQSTRDFVIPDSSCGIPAGAQAYSLNVTVVPKNKLDYITVFPAGQTRPLASLLNSYDGRTKANAAIVPAGTNGGISVFATDATDLIIDINGYFVPDSDTTALAFYPMTPCRIADTRGDIGALGAPLLSAGQERRFPVLSSGCGVPPEAQAYSLNYTVVPSGRLDYLTTWPSGRVRPVVSTLNATTGGITANSAIVPAGDGGDVSVFVTGQTQFILDINGYFAPPATGGLSLYTTAPCRLYDSRTLPNGSPLTSATLIQAANTPCGNFSTARSFVLNSTVVPTGSLLYLSLWGDGGDARPNASVLNAPDGVVTSNMALVPTTNGSVNAFASDSTHLILDLSAYFAP
jgi:hypothetical protein